MAQSKPDRLVDIEYIRTCLKMTPEERFRAMNELNEFTLAAMTPQTLATALRLREKGF